MYKDKSFVWLTVEEAENPRAPLVPLLMRVLEQTASQQLLGMWKKSHGWEAREGWKPGLLFPNTSLS